jgi:hypothetical protein
MLLAELSETEAIGEKARIYAEMRRLGGVPMVALIFRHLASIAGGIEWTWGAMGPAWKTGRLQEAAWKVAREATLQPIAPMPREALTAIGVDELGMKEVRVVVNAYNLANPVNLLTVTCLSRLLDGAKATVALEERAWNPPPAPGPLVPMIDVKTMSREVAALFDLVAAPGNDGGPRVIQSLYRHFGHRPAFLALLVTVLLPRFRDGTIEKSVVAIRAAMDKAADAIAPTLTAPPAPDAGIRPVLQRFRSVIPQMIVVGALIEQALPSR